MKLAVKIQYVLISLLLFTLFELKGSAQAGEAATYQVFYDALAPYGTWIHDATNGYVWAPKAEKNFRPYYSGGSWVMTNYGSTWVSTYPWGWAPFHYGRWVNDALYGWVWIPGTEWGPAWVVWRANGELYGWTPLVPGFTMTQSFSPNYYVPGDWWVFVPHAKLLSTSFLQSAKTGASFNSSVLKTTHVLNNIYTADNTNYISGPRALEFSKATGQHVTVYAVKNAAKPGKALLVKEELTLYNPAVKKSGGASEPKPAKSITAEHAIGHLEPVGKSTGGTTSKTSAKKKSSSAPSKSIKSKPKP